MRIFYSKTAIKAINALDAKTKMRMKKGIEGLVKIPPLGDIKPMEGLNKCSRLRIGKYRYDILDSEKTLFIIDVGSRGDIYK